MAGWRGGGAAVTVEDAEFLRGTRNQLIVFARTRPDDALSTQALADIHDAVARLDNILAREDIEHGSMAR